MKVNCPTCKKVVEWRTINEFRPFCSKKCQLIDLGEWAEEEHVIATPAQPQQFIDPEDIEALLTSQHSDFFKH